MARQIVIPGFGVIHEDGTRTIAVPGFGTFGMDQGAAGVTVDSDQVVAVAWGQDHDHLTAMLLESRLDATSVHATWQDWRSETPRAQVMCTSWPADAALAVQVLTQWTSELAAGGPLLLEGLESLSREPSIPVSWQGGMAVARDGRVPLDWRTSRDIDRQFRLPWLGQVALDIALARSASGHLDAACPIGAGWSIDVRSGPEIPMSWQGTAGVFIPGNHNVFAVDLRGKLFEAPARPTTFKASRTGVPGTSE